MTNSIEDKAKNVIKHEDKMRSMFGVDKGISHIAYNLSKALLEAIEVIEEVDKGNFNQAELLRKARNFLKTVRGKE